MEVQNLEMDGAMEWMMRGMVAHGEYMSAAVLVDDIIDDQSRMSSYIYSMCCEENLRKRYVNQTAEELSGVRLVHINF